MRGIDELSNLERATKEETSGEMTAEEMLKAIYDVIMGKTYDEVEEPEETETETETEETEENEEEDKE